MPLIYMLKVLQLQESTEKSGGHLLLLGYKLINSLHPEVRQNTSRIYSQFRASQKSR
jgi:hypothetical protein